MAEPKQESLWQRFFNMPPIVHVELCFAIVWFGSRMSKFYDLLNYLWCLTFVLLYMYRVIHPRTMKLKNERMKEELVSREQRKKALTYEGTESATWLNVLLVSLWPNLIEPLVSKAIYDNVQWYLDYPEYKKYYEKFLGDLHFDFTLGKRPPLVRSARSYLVPDGVELEWALDFTTASRDMKAAVNQPTKEADVLLLDKLQLRGKLRMRFSRITNGSPYVGGIRIAFDESPVVDLKIKPFGTIDITNSLCVNHLMRELIVGQIIDKIITEPNPLVLNIDQWDSFKVVDTSRPVKKVEVTVIRATDLLPKDGRSGFGKAMNMVKKSELSSDPFVEIRFGTSKKKTRVIQKNNSPVWNDEFVLYLTVKDPRVLIFHVLDWNSLSSNEEIGDAVVRLDEYDEGEYHEKVLDLTNVAQGTLTVRFRVTPM